MHAPIHAHLVIHTHWDFTVTKPETYPYTGDYSDKQGTIIHKV